MFLIMLGMLKECHFFPETFYPSLMFLANLVLTCKDGVIFLGGFGTSNRVGTAV